MAACHAADPGSIPGWCNGSFLGHFLFLKAKNIL
jgi:hypothetical protein